MHIAFATAEALPYSKTGGLGDVSGALPHALADLGHNVTVFTPYYRCAKRIDPKAPKIADGSVPVGGEIVPWTLHQSTIVKGPAKFYLIGHDGYFDREGLYTGPRGEYPDAINRFLFFSRACLAAAQTLGQPVDAWSCHDWQTALIPVYLRLAFFNHPFHSKAGTLFTIHNVSYQGHFWHWDWPLLNLPWKHYNWKELEFYGKINLLKGGLVFSDYINTVSPTYAKQIQTPEYGYGLDGLLGERATDLFGVINGIDMKIWDPLRDPHLPAKYSSKDLAGKAKDKAALLERFKLPGDANTPVLGLVGRLIEQKGMDLIALALEEIARRNVRLVVLGTGDPKFHELLERLQKLFPDRIAVQFTFDEDLAHLIQAGSDIFLMPSRFEPCGLSQLYSLRYGTVPLVHATGGLVDTVTDVTPENLKAGTATGYSFSEYTHQALLACLDRALKTYREDKVTWKALQVRGMEQDWSWSRSAKAYAGILEKAVAKAAVRAKTATT